MLDGEFMGGYGSKDRYELATFEPVFRNSNKIHYRNLNNTNKLGFWNIEMNLPVHIQAWSFAAGWD